MTAERGSWTACLATGQKTCHDETGRQVDCRGSGQDAEFQAGIFWPEPRFAISGGWVDDRLTGLVWTRKANFADFPLQWAEALDFVREMNRQQVLGFDDWRLPNRRELRSLLDFQTRKPALPLQHPFRDVFPGWYWTSTTAAIAPEHAWYVHMEGARMFYGGKDQSYLVWPVRGEGNDTVLQTGQKQCFNPLGRSMDCAGSSQDAEYRIGKNWPVPRFVENNEYIEDRLTGLCWRRSADLTGRPVSWMQALAAVEQLNRQAGERRWRLPNINELEALVDCSQSSPALSEDMLANEIQTGYWSSTTSMFEPDWAWALYLEKGATGVGQKNGPHFHVWPVLNLNP